MAFCLFNPIFLKKSRYFHIRFHSFFDSTFSFREICVKSVCMKFNLAFLKFNLAELKFNLAFTQI